MKNAALSGKPYAGNPHVRFDEGEVASAKPRRGSLLYNIRSKMTGSLLAGVVFAVGFATAAPYYEIPEGDAAALVTALNELAAIEYNSRTDAKIVLLGGVYDLSDAKMNDKSHLVVPQVARLLICGAGEKPGDTILKGAGKDGGQNRRVIEIGGGANEHWNTVSNLTITGGYCDRLGGGAYSKDVATLYVDCVVSNNHMTYTGASYQDHTGGGIRGGCALRTYFADNSCTSAGGAIDCGTYAGRIPNLKPWTRDCYFTNNVQTTGYGSYFGGGAVAGGEHYDDTYIDNRAAYGGAGGYSNAGGRPRFEGCKFFENSSTSWGGTLYRFLSATNCVFVDSSGNGGVFFQPADDKALQLDIVGCSFTNNVSTTLGGVARLQSGFVTNCTFSGNSSLYDGGVLNQESSDYDLVVVDCTFVSNFVSTVAAAGNTKNGGALKIQRGKVQDCTFDGNSTYYNSTSLGGAMYVSAAGGPVEIRGTTFIGNKGRGDGGTIASGRRLMISNCVFTGQGWGYRGELANGQNLVDCVISNVTGAGWLTYNCNLTRCQFVDNTITDALVLDYGDTLGSYTNVNSVFVRNNVKSTTRICEGKVNVNCTFAYNVCDVDWGSTIRVCDTYNSFFFSNKCHNVWVDVETKIGGSYFVQHCENCLFTKIDTDIASKEDGFIACQIVPGDKVRCGFVNGRLTQERKSRATDAARQSPWILSVVGGKDVYGNARVFGKGLDVGAVENQEFAPGLTVIVR